MEIGSDPGAFALVRLLDATALRQRVLANNLANNDTPGFIRNDVPFESELAAAVEQKNLASFAPTVQADNNAPVRADGNNVSIEHEMAEMNKNALLHQMAIQLLQTKLSMQRIAITGRP